MEKLISEEQQTLIEAIEAVYFVNKIAEDKDLDLFITPNYYACDGSPGINVFLQKMRFELGYQYNKVKFGIPASLVQFELFCRFLDNLNLDYHYKEREGIQFLFEIDIDEYLYTDDGIVTMMCLINRVLEMKK